MSDTAESLRHKIASAGELNSVARTMKALSAASIGQYETAVRALNDYYRTVQLGLVASFRQAGRPIITNGERAQGGKINAVVFGSDQGLVGQFNDILVDYAAKELGKLPGEKNIWAVGERIHARLSDEGLKPKGLFNVPLSVNSITPLIGQILIDTSAHHEDELSRFLLFYNSPKSGAVYQPVMHNLLPQEEAWQQTSSNLCWPGNNLPQVIGPDEFMLRTLVREYVFVSLFRACAESLASENASRLAAMQRAEKNIKELLDNLKGAFQRLRQSSIDEELFDVISGYEVLTK
jgi:F-type H+-transporting ATPase subunit gamma